ncbi:ABC transporter ATP-binding protein [Ketogulonicigenium vulgare]|uniref:ABC transporter, ATPase subunit n=1 Tax=Ketogulonicigenium vulgare (strain WSH-001) TaxID=759362 RepID=F9Y749_KETVW|nr:ATP-binding cassette domain-containing protein [Ketogulonicigenium vulgare]ADO41243.1 putative ferric cations import ATP-binding protein fbpC [Ketogulonicigenium vulgare Y25]AEM42239.1 ABC transporter, ATPase subunit [Ketogulonicigenium vulgare WSH-001]ALJ79859.1 ABC transporter ATP-binding protein [Ketogulonicigenium vulgare]AOZ53072.1 ferric cations import ATP-binding protein fbpC [Ketogulonicigenium vulgare]
MPDQPILLSVRDLRSDLTAPLSFDLDAGQCVAVTGPSGAGKSLRLRMIADLLPHDGALLLRGVACADMPATQWRRQVRYVQSEPGWWAPLIGDHIGPSPLLGALGLPDDILTRRVDSASTGERQRVAILRAVADRPAVLLLDEPTAALDEAATRAVEGLVRQLMGGGMGIVLVSHDAAQVARLADQVISLAGRG